MVAQGGCCSSPCSHHSKRRGENQRSFSDEVLQQHPFNLCRPPCEKAPDDCPAIIMLSYPNPHLAMQNFLVPQTLSKRYFLIAGADRGSHSCPSTQSSSQLWEKWLFLHLQQEQEVKNKPPAPFSFSGQGGKQIKNKCDPSSSRPGDKDSFKTIFKGFLFFLKCLILTCLSKTTST